MKLYRVTTSKSGLMDTFDIQRDAMRCGDRVIIFGDFPETGWRYPENWLRQIIIPIHNVLRLEEIANEAR